MSPEERRRKELQEILEKINAEEAQKSRQPAKTDDKKAAKTDNKAAAADSSGKNPNIITVDGQDIDLSQLGLPDFLNELPIFNQFKDDLVNAFKTLDGAKAGAISAQFELNYRSVQMIANEAGGYDVSETEYNFKLDLNYIKAAAGKGKKPAFPTFSAWTKRILQPPISWARCRTTSRLKKLPTALSISPPPSSPIPAFSRKKAIPRKRAANSPK